MYKHSLIKTFRTLTVFVLFVVAMIGAVNQTDAAQPETGLQYHVCQNYDLIYVLDLSGSMGWSYNGSGSRLDAAKDAIVSMNNVLQEDAAGVQASLLTWQGSTIQVKVDFTNNFSSMNSVVNGLSASGTTPTAKAMEATKSHLQNNLDPNRQQIVLLLRTVFRQQISMEAISVIMMSIKYLSLIHMVATIPSHGFVIKVLGTVGLTHILAPHWLMQ